MPCTHVRGHKSDLHGGNALVVAVAPPLFFLLLTPFLPLLLLLLLLLLLQSALNLSVFETDDDEDEPTPDGVPRRPQRPANLHDFLRQSRLMVERSCVSLPGGAFCV